MSDSLDRITASESYQSLEPEDRRKINGLLSLLETGVIPAQEMAATVVMTAIGVTLRDHEKFRELVDGNIYHDPGTNDLILIAGGWVWRLSPTLLGDEEEVDSSRWDRM